MRPAHAVLITVLGATLVGCGQSVAGTPGPTPTDPDGIAIADPRDLAAVADEPCTLLTRAQLDQLSPGLVPEPDTTLWGEPSCRWSNDAIYLSVSPDTVTGAGVNATLLQPGTDRVDVAGYPSARYGDSDTTCTVSVGVADDTELIATYIKRLTQVPEHQQTCQFVESIAATVVGNLPPQQ